MIYIFGGAFDPPHAWHTAIIRSLLHYRHPMKVVILPSGKRNDKIYNISDEHRLKLLEIFLRDIHDSRVIVDDYFIRDWQWEMITRDVDEYARNIYGEDITHIFWMDTIDFMCDWDSEQYAAKVVKKIFIPRWSDEKPVLESIQNYEFFSESHIPDISSTDIRSSIPKYATIHARFENNPQFIIPGLSKKISQYILRNKLYLKPFLQKGMYPKSTSFGPSKAQGDYISDQKNLESSVLLQTTPLQKEPWKPKILVHVCCGPDVTMPILELRDEYDVICFWYDPNIQPKSEYDKRFEAFKKVCEIENIPYIKWVYDVDHFFSRIKWLEHTPEKWEKCTHCYDMRMYVAAKLAKKLKISLYTSSLNTSPKKDLDKLFKIGQHYAEKYGITFLDIPFRKNWGFKKSVEYTTKHNIYRQNYCGCIYSIREWWESEMKRRIVG